MKSSTKDVVKGKFHQAKGKVKESFGKAAGKPNTEFEGRDERQAGKIQEKIGQVEKVFEK
jgi:uncharacterized protein YjbJ (UPF0337 family)